MENKIMQIDHMKQGLLDLISEIEQTSIKVERIDKVEINIFKTLMLLEEKTICLQDHMNVPKGQLCSTHFLELAKNT